MPYLGNTAGNRFVASKAATQFSGDGSTTAFTLDHAVGSDEDILVSVDGVIQEPSVAYAVSNGTTLTFTAAPSNNSGNNIFVYYLFRTVATVSHPSNNALQASDITVDTTTLVTDSTNNRVGVGTASPDANLQVGGALNSAGTYRGALALKTQTVGSITPGEAALYIEETSGGEGYYVGVDSNGAMFFNNSGTSTTLQLGDDGAVTKPLQPAFHVQPSSLQANIAVNTNVTVVYDSETYDVGSNFASNTFTAPITGKYLLCYSLYLQTLDTASNYYEAYINSSNRDYFASTIDPDFGDADWNYFSLTGSSIVDMDANDTAKIVIKQATGTAQSDINTPSFFSGALIC